jgi:hypothetical protein
MVFYVLVHLKVESEESSVSEFEWGRKCGMIMREK